jgi:hypothetical protein
LYFLTSYRIIQTPYLSLPPHSLPPHSLPPLSPPLTPSFPASSPFPSFSLITLSCLTLPHHTVSYRFLPYHTVSYRIMPYHTVSYSELLSAAVAGSLLFGVNDFLKRAAGVPSDGAEESVRYTGSTVPSYH